MKIATHRSKTSASVVSPSVCGAAFKHTTIPDLPLILTQPRTMMQARPGSLTIRRTGGGDEREFLRRAAVLGIRVSPYFAAGGGASSDEE